MNSAEPPTGWLIALDRDDAKRLFACRQTGEWLPTVQQWVATYAGQPERICRLDGTQQAIHEVLREYPPLDQALLGAKPLHRDDWGAVLLVRPDIVPAVQSELAEPGLDSAIDGIADAAAIRAGIDQLRTLYDAAAAAGQAVVYAGPI